MKPELQMKLRPKICMSSKLSLTKEATAMNYLNLKLNLNLKLKVKLGLKDQPEL